MLTEEQRVTIAAKREEALRTLKRTRETLEKESKQGSILCRDCGESTLNYKDENLKTFGIIVCKICRGKSDAYDIITKTAVVDEYLLPESVVKTMRYCSKENPRNKLWKEMKLYMRGDARDEAIKLFGSMDGLQEELSRRRAATYERTLQSSNFAFNSLRDKSEEKSPTGGTPANFGKKSSRNSKILSLVKKFHDEDE